MPVDVTIQKYYSTVMVDHGFAEINFARFVIGAQFDELGPDVVARGDIHMSVVENRCGDDGHFARPIGSPEHFAIFGGNTNNMLLGQLNVLPLASMARRNDRGIVRAVGEFLALPDRFASFFVERDDGTLGPARSANDLIAVHQHGLGVTPAGRLASEVFHRALPENFAVSHIGANERAASGDDINTVALN